MTSPKPKKRRLRGLAFKLSLSLLASVVAVELGIRYVLYEDARPLRKLARKMRDPALFSDRWSDDYWKLRYHFQDPNFRAREPRHDPVLGWMQAEIASDTYTHQKEDTIGDHRPVILYGDSFAACVTTRKECWQGILSRSKLASEYRMLNYGTGGHGFGQIYLLLRQSIDNYATLDPIVIVSLLVDDDMDRSALSFRSWPKPRFELAADGGLELGGPVIQDIDEFLARNPVDITSYAWRYLIYGSNALPKFLRTPLSGIESRFEDMRELNRRILAAVKTELEQRELDYFVLLFYGPHILNSESPDDWRETFIEGALEELEMPYVSARDPVQEHARATGRPKEDYFIGAGRGKNHLTAFGQEVTFEAFREGIARIDSSINSVDLERPTKTVLKGADAYARFGKGSFPPFDAPEDRRRLTLIVGDGGPTEVHYALEGAAKSLRGTLKRIPPQRRAGGTERPGGSVRFEILADGERLFDETLAPDAAPIPVDISLVGVRKLALVVSDAGDGSEGDCVYLATPRLVR